LSMVGTGYPLSARPGGVPWAITIRDSVNERREEVVGVKSTRGWI
jgi:hypothetical protein